MFLSPSRPSLLLRKSRPFIKRLAATGLLSVALTGSAFAAGLVFSDDFESGNTSKWLQDSNRDKCTVVSQSVDGVGTGDGSKMAECNWNGVVAWDSPSAYSTLRLNSWSYSKEFLLRFKVRIASDADRSFGAKVIRLRGTDSYYAGPQLEQSGAPYFSNWELVNGSSGPVSYGNGAFGDGKWHEMEIYVKHNDSGANGALKVWQDGRVIHQATNIVSVSPGAKWFPLYLMSNWSNNGPDWAHDAANHVYWDSIEIYSDSGTGATGSMADGTITGGGSTPPPTAKIPSNPTNARAD